MSKYNFIQVDAFTKTPMGGNPCAIVFDADDLHDGEMLSIAKEMNLSETVFVLKPMQSDFKARYFTPREEIPLAGHPTISLIHVLAEQEKISKPSVTLELPAGIIRVDVFKEDDGFHEITMFQQKPSFMKRYNPEDVLPIFGLEASGLMEGACIQTVSTGTPQLMIPVNNLQTLKKAEMNVRQYRGLKDSGDFFSPHLFCLEGFTTEGNTFARHFGLPPDTFEDPFTGSATGNMACFLWKYRLIEKPHFVAEQGHCLGRTGRAKVEVIGANDDIETVKLSGTAVTVIEGNIRI